MDLSIGFKKAVAGIMPTTLRLLTNPYSKKRHVKVHKKVKQLCLHLQSGVQGRSPIDGSLSILYLSLHRHRPNPKNALARFREPGGGPPPSSEGGEVNSANNVLLTYILAFSSILSMFALANLASL